SRGFLDHPNERSSHETPTPRGGGLVIAAVVLISYMSGSWFLDYSVSIGFITGAVLIVAISWLDDIYSLSFGWRLLVHLVAAAFVIVDVGTFDSASIPLIEAPIYLGKVGIVISILWIIYLVNAYNFMDGIDGIAGVQAAAAGLGWLILGLLIGLPGAVIIGGVIIFASVGFLFHNWQPAKIFMGDAGSAFLGFTFGSMPFMFRQSENANSNILPFLALLFVWPFVFDSALTLFRRMLRGERVWTAHREHLYQTLVISGRSHKWVSTLYGIIALSIAVPAAFVIEPRYSHLLLPLAGVVFVSTLLLITVLFRRRSATKT
ncbi:MAG: glycosyltransferase family 4 protein, partial [Pyrinomonadaceae bacterium]